MRPVISVVIPVHNRAFEVKRAIQSVIDQSVSVDEIIVVENNSVKPDEIESSVNSIGDDRIRFYSLKSCANANVARNFGATQSVGEYLAFLDSDDKWDSDHLKNCLNIMSLYDCDFVYGAARVFDGDKEVVKRSRNIGAKENALDFLLGMKRGYAQTSSFMMRRDVWISNPWDENLKRHQDFDFFHRVVSNCSVRCNQIPDYVIYWKKGEVRAFDFGSVKDFYIGNRSGMSLSTEFRYLVVMSLTCLRSRRFSEFLYFVSRMGRLIAKPFVS